MGLKFKQWLLWRGVRRWIKITLKRKPEMLDKITSFMPGLKSRIGGLGLALTAFGAWLSMVGDTVTWDMDAILAAGRGLFTILASYGLWDKFVRKDGLIEKVIAVFSKMTSKD